MKLKPIFAAALWLIAGAAAFSKDYTLLSPSGDACVVVSNTSGKLEWAVSHKGGKVLEPSAIGLEIKDVKSSSRITKCTRRSVRQQLDVIVPTKFRTINDVFNEMTLSLDNGVGLVVRAYDNGVAYRFCTNSAREWLYVTKETSEYNFAAGTSAFWAYEKNRNFITHCEADFKDTMLENIGNETISYLPLSLNTPAQVRTVLTEADLFDYPNMFLEADEKGKLTAIFPKVTAEYEIKGDRDPVITRQEDYIAKVSGKSALPWRLLTLGTDAELLENTLVWQLSSAEDKNMDWSWMVPGKISWEWWAGLNLYGVDFQAGVNTDTYKYYIDFAAANKLPYILLDEGWSASTTNIKEVQPDLDLAELIRYGKERNVGIVLWVLWTPMTRDMEGILDLYSQWGVKGIKIDFMQAQDQKMVQFYEKVARECAKRQLVADFHGAFKPAGLQRKWPNAMTYEGVYGMEHDKCSYDITPDHDLQLPFTRMVAGPMDYTPGACYNATKDDFAIRWDHPMSQGTRAHQAALFTVYESPLMMLCDTPSNYYREAEFTSFIAAIPTTWDYTVGIEAKAGEYLLMARRNADKWYIGALTNWTGRSLQTTLDFLEEGVEYEAVIFQDGINANRWAQDFKKITLTLRKGDKIDIDMACGGGWAAILTPKAH